METSTSTKEASKHPLRFSELDHGNLLETSGFLEVGNYKAGGINEAVIKGKGEVKCGGEDGKASDGGPNKEKKSGEKVDFYGIRRGRGTVRIYAFTLISFSIDKISVLRFLWIKESLLTFSVSWFKIYIHTPKAYF